MNESVDGDTDTKKGRRKRCIDQVKESAAAVVIQRVVRGGLDRLKFKQQQFQLVRTKAAITTQNSATQDKVKMDRNKQIEDENATAIIATAGNRDMDGYGDREDDGEEDEDPIEEKESVRAEESMQHCVYVLEAEAEAGVGAGVKSVEGTGKIVTIRREQGGEEVSTNTSTAADSNWPTPLVESEQLSLLIQSMEWPELGTPMTTMGGDDRGGGGDNLTAATADESAMDWVVTNKKMLIRLVTW